MRNRLFVVTIALCVLFGAAAACAPAASAATVSAGRPAVCQATTSWFGLTIFWGLAGWNCRAW
jgi:hypothetical protein